MKSKSMRCGETPRTDRHVRAEAFARIRHADNTVGIYDAIRFRTHQSRRLSVGHFLAHAQALRDLWLDFYA